MPTLLPTQIYSCTTFTFESNYEKYRCTTLTLDLRYPYHLTKEGTMSDAQDDSYLDEMEEQREDFTLDMDQEEDDQEDHV